MSIWSRQRDGANLTDLIHHSDRGVQHLAIRYTQRLAEAGALASDRSRGDSHDNALAEAFNSLFKAELIHDMGPWRSIDGLEIATAEYIDWVQTTADSAEIGLIPGFEPHPPHRR